MILSEGMWFDFWSHNQYYLSDGSFYQMKIPLESAVQLIKKEFWAEHISLLSCCMFLVLQIYYYSYCQELIKSRFSIFH
jgi:uncharacterized membrane protein